MDLFKKTNSAWRNAFAASPRMYENDEGTIGVFAITEGADTILPKQPQYKVDNKKVENWRLLMVSTTKQGVLGEVEYFNAIERLTPHIKDIKGKEILIEGLSLETMLGLLNN